jgi:hypothetical protein
LSIIFYRKIIVFFFLKSDAIKNSANFSLLLNIINFKPIDLIGLLKFLLIFFGFTYLFRLIKPFIFRYLIKKVSKKMGDFKTKAPVDKEEKKDKKNAQHLGEYIDYEEID